MNVHEYFRSLTRELEALRDRVENFTVNEPHWQTVGEWKESVLRATLKGNLPANVEPARGFVVTKTRGTSQLDVILYDNTKPVLFRNGDLVFVTPDAVVGIIEVKSRIRSIRDLEDALILLAENAEIVRSRASHTEEEVFVGLFAYRTELDTAQSAQVLEALQNAAAGNKHRVVSYVCIGCSQFTMFWEAAPDGTCDIGYDTWHSYELTDLAAGYFIHNLFHVAAKESVTENLSVWFPEGSKELRKIDELKFMPHNPALADGRRPPLRSGRRR